MKFFILTVLAALSLGIYAARTIESEASDVLRKLNIPEPLAKESIWSSFSGRYLSCPNPAELKKIARGERAAIVQQIGEYARTYANSSEFTKKYLEYREGQKPAPPDPPKYSQELKKEAKESLQKSIRETEESMKTMNAEMKATMKDVLTMLRSQLKSIDDPKNPSYSPQMDDMIKQSYEAQKQDHQQRVAQWEKDYPQTPNRMIKEWLEEFLKVSQDVDFSAKLMEGGGGKMMFAKGEYERKSDKWKMCYRAGRETVESGRAFAARWVKELESAK